jgi:hypothetical protein
MSSTFPKYRRYIQQCSRCLPCLFPVLLRPRNLVDTGFLDSRGHLEIRISLSMYFILDTYCDSHLVLFCYTHA